MPDSLHVEQLIAAIPCRIELPEQWADFFVRSGPLLASQDDDRRFRRFLPAPPGSASLPADARRDATPDKDRSRVSQGYFANGRGVHP